VRAISAVLGGLSGLGLAFFLFAVLFDLAESGANLHPVHFLVGVVLPVGLLGLGASLARNGENRKAATVALVLGCAGSFLLAVALGLATAALHL
jgi:predicted permease